MPKSVPTLALLPLTPSPVPPPPPDAAGMQKLWQLLPLIDSDSKGSAGKREVRKGGSKGERKRKRGSEVGVS